MTEGAARRALGSLAFASLLACSAPGKGPAVRPAVEMLASLSANPAIVPAAIDPETPVVMVLLRLDQGKVVHDSAPIVLPHQTLGLERALAARRNTQPAYWAVQVLADGSMRYWSAVDPVPKVRFSLSGEGGALTGGRTALAETIVAIRVPFFPKSTLSFYDASGKEAGQLLFGDRPEVLLAAAAP